jgi:DNA-directed RNA polymerase subunit K/omega
MANLSFEELAEKSENIYEAVVALSKRARQITDEQKMRLLQEMDAIPVLDSRDAEDFDEVEIDRDALQREREKIPKPTTVAMEEFVDARFIYQYEVTDENEV